VSSLAQRKHDVINPFSRKLPFVSGELWYESGTFIWTRFHPPFLLRRWERVHRRSHCIYFIASLDFLLLCPLLSEAGPDRPTCATCVRSIFSLWCSILRAAVEGRCEIISDDNRIPFSVVSLLFHLASAFVWVLWYCSFLLAFEPLCFLWVRLIVLACGQCQCPHHSSLRGSERVFLA